MQLLAVWLTIYRYVVFHCVHVYCAGCVQWKVFKNQLSTRSLLEPAYKTVAACQNYCIQTNGCVAVDFGVNITAADHHLQCWVHKDVVNLAPRNTLTSVANITQYRLNRTCGQPQISTPAVTRGLSLLNAEHDHFWRFSVHVNPLTTTVANCHMGTAIKPSFVIFDIRALWRSVPSVRMPGFQKLQMTV